MKIKQTMKICMTVLSIVVLLAAYASPSYAATTDTYGTKTAWPSSWTTVSSLNDQADAVDEKIDFVGDATNPGGYMAIDSNYLYFRARLNLGTFNAGTYRESIFVLIDKAGAGDTDKPDYGFVWDAKSNDITKHGLELQVPSTLGSTWGGTRMADIDNNASSKIAPDFMVPTDGTTGNGYMRVIDGQSTTNFGTTTFIDFAVNWSFLSTATSGALAKGQTWRVEFGSIANATDHNYITGDIAGGFSPSTPGLGWSNSIAMSTTPVVIPNPISLGTSNVSEVIMVAGNQAVLQSVPQYASISERTASVDGMTGIISLTKTESFSSIPTISGKTVTGIGMLVDFTAGGYSALQSYLQSHTLESIMTFKVNDINYDYGTFNYDFIDSSNMLSIWIPYSPQTSQNYAYSFKMTNYYDIFSGVSGYDSSLSYVISGIGGDLVYGDNPPGAVPEPATAVSLAAALIGFKLRRNKKR